ncbi:MAG: hypothetical protein KKF43_04315, partial [Proteobacteria bacterium]|nr:hypothetical protein [Pseudomonadota bacterium]
PQPWELLSAKTTILPASAKIRSGQVCASFLAPAQYTITLRLMSNWYKNRQQDGINGKRYKSARAVAACPDAS